MRNIMKAARLYFSLLKPYIKAICFVMLVPVAFTALNRSLISGVSFAMCVISMSTSYTFAISEKNGMERLYYGILPISKKQLVLGNYICIGAMGLLTLVVSLTLHPLVLMALSVPISFTEIFVAGILGSLMFTLYITFQIPGYYKYGSIKGRMFMYIPIVGYLIVFFIFNKVDVVQNPTLISALNSPLTMIMVTVVAMVVLLTISIIASIKIMSQKEL